MAQKVLKTIKGIKPDIRYLNDMKQVLYDRQWAQKAPNTELYYMYRDLKRKNGLRYDITIIPPKMLGKEFVKTKGHYHVGDYGELYIVLKGKAIYLMQKEKNGKILDVYYVRAKKGDSVIIPPGYGHITINPGSKSLKMANWVSLKCCSDYKKILQKKGACYFYTTSGWIKNKNYKRIPKIHFKRPKKSMPKSLKFLK
jgi:glucose-6-phosphate isomerase